MTKLNAKIQSSLLPSTKYLVNNFIKSQEKLHLREKILHAIDLATLGLEKSRSYSIAENIPAHLRAEGYQQKLLYEKYLMWLRELFYWEES